MGAKSNKMTAPVEIAPVEIDISSEQPGKDHCGLYRQCPESSNCDIYRLKADLDNDKLDGLYLYWYLENVDGKEVGSWRTTKDSSGPGCAIAYKIPIELKYKPPTSEGYFLKAMDERKDYKTHTPGQIEISSNPPGKGHCGVYRQCPESFNCDIYRLKADLDNDKLDGLYLFWYQNAAGEENGTGSWMTMKGSSGPGCEADPASKSLGFGLLFIAQQIPIVFKYIPIDDSSEYFIKAFDAR